METRGSELAKVLVPLDGSELSERIVRQAGRILLRKDTEIALVRVLPERDLAGETEPGTMLERARADLDRTRDALRARGARVEAHVLAGDPAERILAFALVERPTLIAMSTHGRSGVARWIRGSVAERVLRGATRPLLLANPFVPATSDDRRFRRILVPLDGSDRAGSILPLVGEIAALYESEVDLVVALDPSKREGPTAPAIGSREEALALLERFAKKLEAARVRLRVVAGSAAAAIVDLASAEGVDLIALTTHGRSGLSRWAFGSVAEQVIRHAPCPLLVKRKTAGDPGEEASWTPR